MNRICRDCERELPIEKFEVSVVKNGKEYRRRNCGDCKQVIQKNRRWRIRAWLDDLKRAACCVRCGNSDYRVLEFHHTSPQEKLFNISEATKRGMSIQTIMEELAKCEIICANCHKIEHYVEPNRLG